MSKKWLVDLKKLSAAVQPLGSVEEEGYPVAHGLLAIAERLEALIEMIASTSPAPGEPPFPGHPRSISGALAKMTEILRDIRER